MPAARVLSDATVRQLDRSAQPDENITEQDVQQPAKLSRLLGRLLRDVGGLLRRANPARIDFDDVVVGVNGSIVQLAHKFSGRARWSIIGWQADTPCDMTNLGMLWVRRAFFGPLTLATTAGNFTTGCRFQLSTKTRVAGARFAWFTTGGAKTITAKLWRDSDGALLGSGTVGVTDSGCYVAPFSTAVLLDGSNLNTDLTISIYDGGTNYTSTGADAAFTGLFPLAMPGLSLKAINLFLAGDARPTSTAGAERYWVEPIVAPPWPGLVEDTAASDAHTLVLRSFVPGVVSVRCEEAG